VQPHKVPEPPDDLVRGPRVLLQVGAAAHLVRHKRGHALALLDGVRHHDLKVFGAAVRAAAAATGACCCAVSHYDRGVGGRGPGRACERAVARGRIACCCCCAAAAAKGVELVLMVVVRVEWMQR